MTLTEEAPAELLVPVEVAPVAPKADNVPTCPECGDEFGGIMGKAHLSRHMKFKHNKAPEKPKAPAKKAAKAQPKPRAPKVSVEQPKPRRQPAADMISMAVSGAAQVLAQAQPPVAAVLSFEAPAAGHAIDQAIAGSTVDRVVVQRLVKAESRWQAVGSVVALPLLVSLVSNKPILYQPLEPYLRSCVEDVLVQSIPAMKKRADRTRKAAQAVAELKQLDPSIAESDDPVGDILRGIFSSMIETEGGEG